MGALCPSPVGFWNTSVVFWDLEHGGWETRWLDTDMRRLGPPYIGRLVRSIIRIINLNPLTGPYEFLQL